MLLFEGIERALIEPCKLNEREFGIPLCLEMVDDDVDTLFCLYARTPLTELVREFREPFRQRDHFPYGRGKLQCEEDPLLHLIGETGAPVRCPPRELLPLAAEEVPDGVRRIDNTLVHLFQFA